MLHPAGNRILIETIESTTTSAGGIVLTGNKDNFLHGKVLEAGEYVDDVCKPGDIVVYGNRLDNVKDKIDGKDVVFVKEEAIVGYVR